VAQSGLPGRAASRWRDAILYDSANKLGHSLVVDLGALAQLSLLLL
jgi:hypothetical protein